MGFTFPDGETAPEGNVPVGITGLAIELCREMIVASSNTATSHRNQPKKLDFI